MHAICIDSNVVFEAVSKQPGFRIPTERGPFASALAICRSGKLRIAVNALVLDEVKRRVKRECDPTRGGRRSARALAQLGLNGASELEERLDLWRDETGSLLASYGVEIGPVPEVRQGIAVQRLLEGRRPFTGRGDEGYRDFLIWEAALLSASSEGTTVFVSRDARGFSAPDQPGALHPYLAEEADSRIGHPGAVSLAESLAAALEILWPDIIDSRPLGSDVELIADISMEAADLVSDLAREPSANALAVFGAGLTGFRVDGITGLVDASAHEFAGGRISARVVLTADVGARLDSDADPSDCLVDLEDVGRDWVTDEWHVAAHASVDVNIAARVDHDGRLISIDVRSWDVVGDARSDPRQLALLS